MGIELVENKKELNHTFSVNTHQMSYRLNVFIILILCLANILNLFADRGGVSGDMSEETSGGIVSRTYIQGCYVLVLFMMMPRIFTRKIKPIITPILLITVVIAAYIVWDYFNAVQFSIGNYIRLILNLSALLFFYGININIKPTRKAIQLFCITFLASLCFKIISSAVFTNSSLGAGDTASIGLAFLLPLLMLSFKPKTYMPLIAIALFFILLSVRRTSIVAAVLSFMCFIKFEKVRIKHVVIGLLLMVITFHYAYEYAGEQIVTRFGFVTSNDRTVTMGSGREFFYVNLIDSYLNSTGKELLFGHGLGAIARHFAIMGDDYLNHAHNDYLEILYTFGLIGLLIWCYFVILLFKVWKKASKTFERKIFLSCLLSYLAISLLSGCLLRIETLPFIFTLSILLPKMTIVQKNT